MTNAFSVPKDYVIATNPDYIIKSEDLVNSKDNNGHKDGWIKVSSQRVGSKLSKIMHSLDVASFTGIEAKPKYVAIKLVGFKSWFWFEAANVTETDGRFVGKAGWGQEGAFTEVDVNKNDIESRLESDQY